jgi:hypothetical protein
MGKLVDDDTRFDGPTDAIDVRDFVPRGMAATLPVPSRLDEVMRDIGRPLPVPTPLSLASLPPTLPAGSPAAEATRDDVRAVQALLGARALSVMPPEDADELDGGTEPLDARPIALRHPARTRLLTWAAIVVVVVVVVSVVVAGLLLWFAKQL